MKILRFVSLFILVAALLCFLNSCGEEVEKEPELTPAQKVEAMIDELRLSYGSTFDEDNKNEEALIAAEKAYEKLSESEKTQVKNSSKLKEARNECDRYNLLDVISGAGKAKAKRLLKTPSSFELISEMITFYLDPTTEKVIGAKDIISFSGTNSFGGRQDSFEIFCWTIDENGNREDYSGSSSSFEDLMESKNAIKLRMKS